MTSFFKYGTLYDCLLISGKTYPEYDIIEIFLTLNGVRPACLLSIPKSCVEIFGGVFSEKDIGFVKYPFNSPRETFVNYLIIGPSANFTLLSATMPIIRSGFERNSRNEFDIATGCLLGYLFPTDVTKIRGGRAAGISVEIDGTPIKGIMPQRVGDATDVEIHAYFKPKMDLLEDLYVNPSKYHMPFKLTKPPEIFINDVPLRGGATRRRRRTRRARTTKG
jgi:hypothetical protein